MSKERQKAIADFQADMALLEPEAHDRGSFATFKHDPQTFRYVNAEYLYTIWCAGRKRGGGEGYV